MLNLIMQAAPAGGAGSALGSFLPIILIGIIFYFLPVSYTHLTLPTIYSV